MSPTPPPQPVCPECGTQKSSRTEEITYNATNTDSATKRNQGSADLQGLVGERNHEETETTETTTGRTSVNTAAVCPTPGCPQRKRDIWQLRRWVLRHDPNRSDSSATREWELQKIEAEEQRYVAEIDRLSTAHPTTGNTGSTVAPSGTDSQQTHTTDGGKTSPSGWGVTAGADARPWGRPQRPDSTEDQNADAPE